MEPQTEKSSYSPRSNMANSYRTANKYPDNVSPDNAEDKHVTERKYIVRLEFVRTYAGTYLPGDHINLDDYTVALIYSDGSFKAVTRECRYNLGSEEVVIGGIVLKPNDGNPEHYTFTGYDPEDLIAFYTTIEGRELMASTDIKALIKDYRDLNNWEQSDWGEKPVNTYDPKTTMNIFDMYDTGGKYELLFFKLTLEQNKNYIFSAKIEAPAYAEESAPQYYTYMAITATKYDGHLTDPNNTNEVIAATRTYPGMTANYSVHFNTGNRSEIYLCFDFSGMEDGTRTTLRISNISFMMVD